MRTILKRATRASLAEAARVLKAGGLVVFPTETVYGLGGRAFDPKAAKRIYRAKGRPTDNPLIVHVADAAMLARVVRRVPPLSRRLMAAFWPGPLTLVFDKAAAVPMEVTAGLDTVAVRMPSHPAARELLLALGEPIAAPSANRSGRPSPTTAAHAARDLKGRVAMILDAGPCERGLESAIVDARGRRPVLLRSGTLSPQRIAKAAGASLAAPSAAAPPVPGTRHRHYAPDCRVHLISPAVVRRGALPPGAGLLHRSATAFKAAGWHRRVRGGLASYARSLFGALRDAETSGISDLYVETVPETGVGRAVMDRLRRAAQSP